MTEINIQDELSMLVTLQHHDNTIAEAQSAVDGLAASIGAKKKGIESLKASAKTAKENLTALGLKKKQLEGDAENQEKIIKKHHSELNALKTNDAYKAMLSEIESAKNAQTKIEDDILALMEKIDQEEKRLKELDLVFKRDEDVVKKEIASLEGEKAAAEGVLSNAKAARDAFATGVPARLLDRYTSINNSRGGSAIVPVVNSSCSGCRMKLTQSKGIEVKKGKAMVICDSCSRILYLPPEEKKDVVPAVSLQA